MPNSNDRDRSRTRRRFLRWVTTASLAAAAGCGGSQSPPTPSAEQTVKPTQTETPIPSPPASPTEVDVRGRYFPGNIDYWAWFPSDQDLWSRSADPFDFRADNRRWLAWPTGDDSIRCRVEGDEPPGNAGFYLGIGPIGSVQDLTIESEPTHSDRDGTQQLLIALYFDVTGDDDYFDWEQAADREAFTGLAGDREAIGTVPAGGSSVIDDDTELDLVPPAEEELVTLGEIKAGDVDGVWAATEAALQVSVMGSGQRNVEEAIVNQVKISSEPEFTAEDWPTFAYDHLNIGSTVATGGPTESVAPEWTFETRDAVRSGPVVADGTVYVGSDDGALYAIDAATGEERWSFETGGPIEGSPAAYGYMVLVGSHDSHVYGIDVTGQRQWAFETDDRVRTPQKVKGSLPKLGGDIVVSGSDDGFIYILNPWTGELVDSYNSGAPVVAAPMLYTNAAGQFEVNGGNTAGIEFGYFPQSGGINRNDRWAPIRAAISAPHNQRENIWYLANDDGRLDRWETEPFESIWTFHADDKIRSSPVLASPYVFVGSWDGTVYALDEQTGDVTWTVETDGKIDSTPAATDGSVFFGSTDGSVYGIDAEGGDIEWTFETGGEVRSSPAVVDGTVFIGNNDGKVYALSAE